jgi:hypothetical protein
MTDSQELPMVKLLKLQAESLAGRSVLAGFLNSVDDTIPLSLKRSRC